MTKFKAGELYTVDWSHERCCCDLHSDDDIVVFIREYEEGCAEVAYDLIEGGVCVGYVPYSALSEE